MRKIIAQALISIGLFIFIVMNAHADGLGTYSTGERMGMLSKFSVKGLVMKSGEGEMLLGRNSSMLYVRDSQGHKKYINPWAFSSLNPAIQKALNA